ncbi:monovalent cation/H+ antiporter complex subunit F [Amycolatopsis sp. NPDC059021]|uniref:monovalent cation/H+ antiporter complex subunit F n=1 Tax=Amycolatopsis sp. NPDC059021 TaxID=3346704 RepID=UPI00366D1FE2
MTGWLIAGAVLLVGGLGPALWLAARGSPSSRMAGLELGGAVTVLTLLVLAQGYGPSSALILPLVLALLAFAGTLVFVRLLGQR